MPGGAPGQSHLNLGTEAESHMRIVQFILLPIIDALYKPFEKLDAIALLKLVISLPLPW